jgi:small subunit ribosomal protein S17
MPKKVLKGLVKSNKMAKTVVVAVELPKKHPIYGKTMKNTMKFKAHTEEKLEVGATVLIEESKPFSKEVTWVVKEKLEKEGK